MAPDVALPFQPEAVRPASALRAAVVADARPVLVAVRFAPVPLRPVSAAVAGQHVQFRVALLAEVFSSSLQQVLLAQKWPDVPQGVGHDSAQPSGVLLALPGAAPLASLVRET